MNPHILYQANDAIKSINYSIWTCVLPINNHYKANIFQQVTDENSTRNTSLVTVITENMDRFFVIKTSQQRRSHSVVLPQIKAEVTSCLLTAFLNHNGNEYEYICSLGSKWRPGEGWVATQLPWCCPSCYTSFHFRDLNCPYLGLMHPYAFHFKQPSCLPPIPATSPCLSLADTVTTDLKTRET